MGSLAVAGSSCRQLIGSFGDTFAQKSHPRRPAWFVLRAPGSRPVCQRIADRPNYGRQQSSRGGCQSDRHQQEHAHPLRKLYKPDGKLLRHELASRNLSYRSRKVGIQSRDQIRRNSPRPGHSGDQFRNGARFRVRERHGARRCPVTRYRVLDDRHSSGTAESQRTALEWPQCF